MTLTEFLLARIAEDEAIARAATPEVLADESMRVGEVAALDGSVIEVSQARVLAECEAKRQIVIYLGEQLRPLVSADYYDEENAEYRLSRTVLCMLAQPYADHADYDRTWRP